MGGTSCCSKGFSLLSSSPGSRPGRDDVRRQGSPRREHGRVAFELNRDGTSIFKKYIAPTRSERGAGESLWSFPAQGADQLRCVSRVPHCWRGGQPVRCGTVVIWRSWRLSGSCSVSIYESNWVLTSFLLVIGLVCAFRR